MPAPTRTKARVLKPLFFLLLLLAGGVIGSLWWEKHRDLDREFDLTLRSLENSFQVVIENHAKRLAVAIEGMTDDEQLLNAFLLQDRETLTKNATRIFEKLSTDYGATQLHFIDPGRHTILRAHDPANYGDIVNRQTLLAAQRTEKLSYGIELGPSGLLNLRVVAPWYKGRNLVGYVELSEEVAQILNQVKSIFGIDFYVALKQNLLDKNAWQQSMRTLGREGYWNNEGSYAIAAQTMPGTPASLLDYLESDHPEQEQILFTAITGKRRFHIGSLALADVSGREVGKIAILHDITAAMDNIHDVLRYAALVAGGIALLLLAFFYEIMLRVEKSLVSAPAAAPVQAPRPDKAAEKIPPEPEKPTTITVEALYDRVTGLPIGALLHDRLNHEIAVAQRDNKSVAAMLINVGNLGDVGENFGEEIAGQLLHEVGRRLKEGLRRSDTISRTGVNQLGLILPSVTPEVAVAAADKILAMLSSTYELGKITVDGKFFAGLSIFPYHGHDAETLLDRAENARHIAEQTKQRFSVFDSRRDTQKQKQVSLLSDLQRAIADNDLILNYFPRVDMSSGKVNGAEALVRWRHSEQGHIPPEEIVALAEKSGLIKPLTRWAANKAFRQQANWRKNGIDLNLSINVTIGSLLDTTFYDYIHELQTGWKIPANSITFEIPEKALLEDRRRVTAAMERLHTMGFLLALDDVGTGHSASPYLKSIPVAELKIHESVIYTITENSNNFAFLRSTIDFAHGLGILVTAEGVKNKAIWDVLSAYQCDMAQGYHINQPSTSGAFECWLTNSKYGLGRKDSICTWRPDLS